MGSCKMKKKVEYSFKALEAALINHLHQIFLNNVCDYSNALDTARQNRSVYFSV